jgi:dTDP-4-dehydrorhamnose reductase
MAISEAYKNILVIGESGQLAQAFRRRLPSATYISRKDLDLSDSLKLKTYLQNANFDLLINTAAYTKVDLAETNSKESFVINAEAPALMALAAREKNALFVHFSTDYVFDGSSQTGYSEEDVTYPLSVYGQSKLEGEVRVQQSGANFLIFRTSWVYSETGHNFLKTMLRLGREKSVLRVVSDQIGSPTYAGELAEKVLAILASYRSEQKGLYHLTSQGSCSWHEFAEAIFALAQPLDPKIIVEKVEAITTAEYPTAATRPGFSLLDNAKATRTWDVKMNHWQAGLRECIKNIYANS